jgi:hypothetical protein
MSCAVAESNQENCAFAFGVWGKEADYVVVVKGETGRAQVLGVSCEIELAAEKAGFELYGAISAVPKALQDRTQIRQKENVHGGVCGQPLFQSQITCLVAKVSRL